MDSVTQMALGAAVGSALLGRNRLSSTFRLQRAGAASYLGAALLGFGAWAFAHEAFVIAEGMLYPAP